MQHPTVPVKRSTVNTVLQLHYTTEGVTTCTCTLSSAVQYMCIGASLYCTCNHSLKLHVVHVLYIHVAVVDQTNVLIQVATSCCV